MVRPDPVRQGRGGGPRDHRRLLAGHVPEGISCTCPARRAYRGAWQETIAAAEQYNEPGRFTAFIGYEWTSNTGGNNLHRNVIFRDNGDRASQVEPFTVYPALGSDNPRDLWKWMAGLRAEDRRQRARHRAQRQSEQRPDVPRSIEAFGKSRSTASMPRQRARWERLYEATQTKGDGEAHPFLSPNDEFANFERWDFGNLDVSAREDQGDARIRVCPLGAEERPQARSRTLGVNPYKFGLIGSSDAHTGLAAMEEDNFFGKTTPQEPSPERMHATFFNNPKTGIKIMDWQVVLLGLCRRVGDGEHPCVAVGCDAAAGDLCHDRPAHDRAASSAAGTSRRRMRNSRCPAMTGYTKGVPMGGELRAAPQGKSPSFLVAALKDPLGANLDRIPDRQGLADRRRQDGREGL